MLAAIQLNEYYISKINFEYDYQSEMPVEMKFGFNHDIKYIDNETVEVTIDCSVRNDVGFNLNVKLHGLFDVTTTDEEDRDNDFDVRLKDLCEKNTLSILFPYLRSAISDISLKANIDPIILPTINILSLVENNKKRKESQLELELELE
ncbi:protein-export chaperone SecB [Paenibacillus anseongense]|uniref:protein-export chaperone SecB n=1 Tax=Paenibacillus anseongense TaxID=2682845 RepID=UPI002DBBDE18|nr:protein-export chaperone SecB [Paenibacillus anseongense]MEC0266723.1 protein-export chaperone SecB [Paenibacillus anseongense]